MAASVNQNLIIISLAGFLEPSLNLVNLDFICVVGFLNETRDIPWTKFEYMYTCPVERATATALSIILFKTMRA